MAIATLIVDDEPLARERIRMLLKEEPDFSIAGECADGGTAVAAIRDLAPRLVFLDVQMPGMDGFQVIEAVGPARMPAVIFVTAFDQHAVKAFEVNAVDYLLKPFDDERFAAALRRARREPSAEKDGSLESRLAALLGQVRPTQAAGPLQRLVIKSSGRVTLLSAAEVDWVEATGNYVRIHVGNESHLMRGTLGGLAARLDPARFCRIHRSTLVNVDRIKEMQPSFHGDYLVVLKDGTRLTLKHAYRDGLRRLLDHPF